jgi:hypothetical protein
MNGDLSKSVICPTCGGQYLNPQRQGEPYTHTCPDWIRSPVTREPVDLTNGRVPLPGIKWVGVLGEDVANGKAGAALAAAKTGATGVLTIPGL